MLARKIVYTFLTLVVLLFVYLMIGTLAPDVWEGEVTKEFQDRKVDVWKNLVSVDVIPLRKRDVEKVVILSEDIYAIAWREELKNGGSRTMRVVERDSPDRFVIERFKSTNGVTGTWEFNLETVGNKTAVTIKEKSLNKNVWLRAYYTVIGRTILLRREVKSLRVSLFQRLLITP